MKRVFIIISLCVISLSPLAFAQSDYRPHELIIKLKPRTGISVASASDVIEDLSHDFSEIKGLIPLKKKSTGIQVLSMADDFLEDVYILRLDEDSSPEQMAEALSNIDSIDYAEPNYMIQINSLSNDTHAVKQKYLDQAYLDWPAGDHPIVAIVDSGIDYEHEDLQDVIFLNAAELSNNEDDDANGFIDDIYGYNFFQYDPSAESGLSSTDAVGHGTHLAGIIAAKTNNETGISGINQDARLLNVRFTDHNGMGAQSDAAMGIRYAVDMGAEIINCSWGYSKYNSILKDAINYALDNDVIVVAASGNDGWGKDQYPSSFEGVISVASVNNSNRRSYFSNFGDHIDFAAPGELIYSSVPDNKYKYKSGTSQSAAIMTAIASKILSMDPTLTSKEVITLLQNSADDVVGTGFDKYSGHGVINPSKLGSNLMALSADLPDDFALIAQSSAETTLKKVLPFPNPMKSSTASFGFETNKASLPVKVEIYSLRGQRVNELTASTINGYNKVDWTGTDFGGSNLPNGTYLYMLSVTDAGKTLAQKGKLSILK